MEQLQPERRQAIKELALAHDWRLVVLFGSMARDGVCLHEAEAGLFHTEQDRAFFLHADSVLFQHHGQDDPDAA